MQEHSETGKAPNLPFYSLVTKTMADKDFKIESGLQLLARLTRKIGIKGFYPHLFEEGPDAGQVIELYSEQSTTYLLKDIISELLLPLEVGGSEGCVLIFNTDGHLCSDSLFNSIKRKIKKKVQCTETNCNDNNYKIDKLFEHILRNIYIINLEDVNQFYITIQNLDNILSKHPYISLIVFDSLTAFYWSEQGLKITKMDLYLKTLLLQIQRITNHYKVTILFTRPEYFSSTKAEIEKLEACSQHVSEGQVNYRVQVVYNNNNINYLNIQNSQKVIQRKFHIVNDEFLWD